MNLENIKLNISEMLRNRGEIVFAYLHGSVLEHENYNDIDIAAYVNSEIIKKDFLDYEMEVSTELEQKLRYPVDFKLLNRASAGFAYHATSGELLLSRDDHLRYDFLERTWQEYFDYKPLIKEFLNDLIP